MNSVWRPACFRSDSNELRNFMEQSTSCEADSRSDSQEIPRLLWKPNVHYRVQKSPPVDPVPKQLKRTTPSLIEIAFNTAPFPQICLMVLRWFLPSFQVFLSTNYEENHDSSVGIAPDYGLDDRGSRVRVPVRAGNFSLHHRVQNGSGAHPVFYPMGTRDSFLGVKRPGREADHPPPSSAWSYTSTPRYAFMA
jgi:hypothetical protein